MHQKSNVTDQILDLLLEALAERQRARATVQEPEQQPDRSALPQGTAAAAKVVPANKPVVLNSAKHEAPVDAPAGNATLNDASSGTLALNVPYLSSPMENGDGETEDDHEPFAWDEAAQLPDPVPLLGLGPMLGRLALLLALFIVIVNVPFNRTGTTLARAMPDEASLIIRDGLVLKGSSDRIYVLENNQLRWISSLDAFHHYGYRWEQVREVEDSFLAGFEEGRPIHLLLKCPTSPHVYALEDGRKRWIKDIPTFEAEGYVWEDVTFVSCEALRNRPDGVPIPPDAGSPP